MITSQEIQYYQSLRFDAQFARAHQTGEIAWYPWVGKNYSTASCKVLVILESHYINWERNNIEALALPNFTRRIVAEQLLPQYRWFSNTFNNLSICLSGTGVAAGRPNLLWERACLYNFIQRPMDNPNERPNMEDSSRGWQAFVKVVDILRPKVCIFAGFAAISHIEALPAGLKIAEITPWEPEKLNGTYPRPCFTIQTPCHTMQSVAVKHPGSFFTAEDWRTLLKRQVPEAIKALTL